MSSNISSFAPPPINRYRSHRSRPSLSLWYTLPASTRTGLVALTLILFLLPFASFGLSQTTNYNPKAATPGSTFSDLATPSATPLNP